MPTELDTDIPSRAMTGKEDKTVESFIKDIERDAEPTREQRISANMDMRFVNVDNGMWEDFDTEKFQNRATLQFDKVSPFVSRFIAKWNSKRIGVDFKPDNRITSEDDAKLLKGIYLADFEDGKGKLSTDVAVRQVAICGYGAFKLATRMNDEDDPEDEDQRIEWRPLYNAYDNVIWDLSAQALDKSDARYCTILTLYTEESFEDTFPGFEPISAYNPEDEETTTANDENRPKHIYVATRYQVVRKDVDVHVYMNLAEDRNEFYDDEEHEELKAELKADVTKVFLKTKKMPRQWVEKSIFTGLEFILKPTRIVGKWIPIIPVYGERDMVDGIERWKGLVRPLKDPSRLFNMSMSRIAETSSTSGSRTPIVNPGQLPKPFADIWADQSKPQPFLPINPSYDKNGNLISAGPVDSLPSPEVDQNAVAIISTVTDYLREQTGGAPQETVNPDASGKAIKALMEREDANTQPIMDNIAMAIEWSGVVYKSMAEEVYNRKRVIRIIGEDGTESEKILQQDGVDPKTGRPIKLNDLSGRKFRAKADTGPQYESLQEETVENFKGMIELFANIPGAEQYMPLLISILVQNTSGAGLKPLKEFNRKIMLIQGHVKPETDEEIEFITQLQAQAGEGAGQEQLMQALSAQAIGEAIESESKARKADADTIDALASAQKKAAETEKIKAETEGTPENELKRLREALVEQATELPLTSQLN